MYDLSQFLTALRRRSRLAIALFIILAGIGGVAVMLMPRTYATTSEVLIKRPDTALQTTNYPQIDALLAWNRDEAIETYAALARQPAIAEAVVRELGLKTTAKDLLTGNIVVTPLTNSDIINIAVDWRDPSGSAAVANAFARAFVERQRQLAAAQASEAAASIAVALNKAQSDLSATQRTLTQFETQHQLADAPTQTAAILAAISDVQSRERAVQTERVGAQGQLTRIEGKLASLPSTVDASKVISVSPAVAQIQQQLAQQQLNLRVLQRQFTARYPDVIASENQIAMLQSELKTAAPTNVASTNVEPNPLGTSLVSQAATLEAQIAGNASQLNALRSQEAALVERMQGFPEDVAQLSSLQRQVKSAESIYNALQTNYFNALVAKSMAVSDLYIVQDADPALATVRPPRFLALLTVMGIAFLATLAVIAALESIAVGSLSLSEAR